ncbi:MAG: hypothetical protein AAGF95_03745 [Chloroflexota bacterium]
MTAEVLTLNQGAYARQVQQTRQLLDTIDDTSLADLTRLGIGEVRGLKQEVAEIFPASNLPSILLQGLIQLEDRSLKQDKVESDLRVLFRGSKQLGIYGTFLAGPALVLYGYQRLLSLAGKDIDSAFPDGPWQFYTQFGLREDAARHCVETTGFHHTIPEINDVDSATSWVYAAMQTLFAYDDFLANEWQERMLFRLLGLLIEERAVTLLGKKLPRKQVEREQVVARKVAELQQNYRIASIEQGWAVERPYGNPINAPLQDYAAYRHERFQVYLERALRHLPTDVRTELEQRYKERRAIELPAYQQQLTMLMTLHGDSFQERPAALSPHLLQVAFVAGGRYYLIDACARDRHGNILVFPADGFAESAGIALRLERTEDGSLCDPHKNPIEIRRNGRVYIAGKRLGRLRPPSIEYVKSRIEAILQHADAHFSDSVPPTDMLLAQAPREYQQTLREQLNDTAQTELAMLRYAPIVINWDMHDSTLPLSELRRTNRGCGDHALTLIRTEGSMIFDMSHVFYDAIWGMALAEIMTGFATSCHPSVKATSTKRVRVKALRLSTTPSFLKAAQSLLAEAPVEVAAETAKIDLASVDRLRRRLPKIQLSLTVNDLLILGRCAHATSYRPGGRGQRALEAIAEIDKDGMHLMQQIVHDLEEQRTINPAILIPMDASNADPRLRLYPATFRNPLPDLLPRLERCDGLVRELRRFPDAGMLEEFENERHVLYRDLFFFSSMLRALRDVTMRGKNFTTTMLQLMGHLPGVMQHLVDAIPQKIGILNEIIKGREVFSNVGRVVASSSLTRFTSARDDGDTKLLVWGVLTDANSRLVVTLRDFRPHVTSLHRVGREDLARTLTQDYLDAYALGINELVGRIQRVMSYK